jgi:crotonobetainyl-CoA:carnitine CoA-transferase CaiB-like acyl-CoA transferase
MVRDVEEVLGDQHMHDRGMMRDIEHPIMGDVTLLNSPLNVATGSMVEPRMPPELGEHNDLVFGELGMSAKDIHQLIKDGVIGGRPGKD